MNQVEVRELTDEHRDGTVYADVKNDLWSPHLYGGWIVTHRMPFTIVSEFMAEAQAHYGPYRPVLGPPQRSEPQ